MDPIFQLDDTQALLQSSLQRWLQDNAPFERRAALLAKPAAFQPLWNGLAQQLGLLGAALPEAVGGQGRGLADHLVILQALGQALLPEPYSACLVTGAGLLQRLPSAATQALLAGVADGAVRPVLAALEPAGRHDLAQVASLLHADGTLSGRKALVRAAPQATHWLVTARDGAGMLRLALVRPGAAGTTQRDLQLADGSWAAELAFDHTPTEALPCSPFHFSPCVWPPATWAAGRLYVSRPKVHPPTLGLRPRAPVRAPTPSLFARRPRDPPPITA